MLDANPALVPSQLKAGMTSTAIDWGAAGPDGEYGAGRLDAYAAIRAVGAPIGAPPVVPVHSFREGAVSVGGSVDVPITVQESGYPFAAAVVAPNWSTGTQGPDFDLALLDASGGLVASAATPPVTGWPDRRRHEELALARLAPGSYTLRVRSVNGAGGFLLDVSGGGIGPPSGSPPPPPSVPPAAPTVVVTPSISGAAREGVTLTAADGTWNAGGPIAFSRQWHRCDRSGAICADIAGATTRTYALGRLDVGSTVRVAVSATAGGGTASAVSASTAVVVRGDDEAPVVRAIASSGRRGRTVKLFYRVSEASGKTSERVRVYRRGRVLRALATPIARREAGRSHYVYWRAPRRPMRLRFCVRAWDAARNASALSCAPLRIR
jgi:hypothetical protein